jgi:hypothetical protein
MPNLPDPATGKFLAAVNDFMENPPRDLPEGAADQLKAITQALQGYESQSKELSPGQKQLLEVGGKVVDNPTEGTGNHYSKAALGADQPSPGQREFQAAVEEMNKAAAAIAANGS